MSGGGQIQETAAQRALATNAAQRLVDYKTRWLPVQQQLAAQIEGEGKPGSWQRTEAKGKASTDAAMNFGRVQGAVEASLTNHGAAPGSGRFAAGVTGTASDAAKSSGLGQLISDEQITDAYTKGLGALAQIGQGQSATVANSMTQQAQSSALQAQADAQASLQNREAVGGVVGQVAGMGFQQYMAGQPPPVVQGSNPNGYGGVMNNPSAYVGG
jgi:hypothetical protein